MANITVILESMCCKPYVDISDENKDLWNSIKTEYGKEIDEEWIAEEQDEKVLFFPEFADEERDGDDFEVPYDENNYGSGQDVASSNFFAVTKGAGAGWSTNGTPYSDDFYKKLAEMFGDYSYTIYLFEDTEDTEQRLFIEVTKDNINVSVAD